MLKCGAIQRRVPFYREYVQPRKLRKACTFSCCLWDRLLVLYLVYCVTRLTEHSVRAGSIISCYRVVYEKMQLCYFKKSPSMQRKGNHISQIQTILSGASMVTFYRFHTLLFGWFSVSHVWNMCGSACTLSLAHWFELVLITYTLPHCFELVLITYTDSHHRDIRLFLGRRVSEMWDGNPRFRVLDAHKDPEYAHVHAIWLWRVAYCSPFSTVKVRALWSLAVLLFCDDWYKLGPSLKTR